MGGKTVEKKWFFYELDTYKFLSYNEMSERVTNYGAGLVGLGLKAGERVAIYDETCLEWTLCEHACFSQSLVLVTVYSNLGVDGAYVYVYVYMCMCMCVVLHYCFMLGIGGTVLFAFVNVALSLSLSLSLTHTHTHSLSLFSLTSL
jgi:AMP-binding enzyme